MSFAIGDTIGQYRIVGQIGQGGMATVFKAYHANLDRYVAFKVLHPAFKEDASFLERFQREAQIVARLEHRHIVPVYDFADHQGQPYLVMKFIEGETLKARLKKGTPPLDETIRLLAAVAEALTYAHQHGVLHRDIKPSNIMLDGEGIPYIADFGLARIAQAGESTLSQDMMLGTPQYISPEQAKGIRDLGPGTDIYSLGVVIYEMVVGRTPFSADTPFAIIHDHIYKPLPLPTQVNPAVPAQVERVLLKALDKEPQARYASAVEMVAAFRAAVQEAGMTELSAAHYRPGIHPEAPTAATAPEVASASPSPVHAGVPSPAAPSTSNTASRRAYRRRANLWILSGFGALLLTCLLSLFIIVRAVSNEDAQPWSVDDTASAEEDPLPELPPPVAVFNPPPDLNADEVRDFIAEHPDEPIGYFYLALAQLQTGEQQEAVSTTVYAITQYDVPPDLIAEVARYAYDQDQIELATWLYLELIAQDDLPSHLRNQAGEFLAMRTQEDTLRLRTMSNTYLERREPSAQVFTIHALSLLANSRELTRRQAKTSLDRALELNDSLAETYLVRGLYYHASGQLDEAVADWRYALSFEDTPGWVVRQARDMLDTVQAPAS